MSASSKLNLRPQERRLIAFVAIVLFVVLNIWLVWPHFGDWGKLKMRQFRAMKTFETYRAEIAKVPDIKLSCANWRARAQASSPKNRNWTWCGRWTIKPA